MRYIFKFLKQINLKSEQKIEDVLTRNSTTNFALNADGIEEKETMSAMRLIFSCSHCFIPGKWEGIRGSGTSASPTLDPTAFFFAP